MIKIGVNFTSPQDLPIMQELISNKSIDFVEILIDNFMLFDPSKVIDALQGVETSFHIMNSGWTTNLPFKSREKAESLKKWIKAIRPAYVSDHLFVSEINGARLPLNVEVNYDQSLENLIDKANNYQDCLGATIIFENYPSYYKSSISSQCEFLRYFIGETKSSLLFDFSNALIAEKNTGQIADKWLDLIYSCCTTFHIGGYDIVDNLLFFDTHDRSIDKALAAKITSNLSAFKNGYLVVERDSGKNFHAFNEDIKLFNSIIQRVSYE